MIKANFVTAREAAAMVKDGDTVCTVGMTLVSASESILKALEKDFIETGHPCGMTLLHSCGQSDRKDGIQHFAHEGMIKRIIGSHWGLQPRWMHTAFPRGRLLSSITAWPVAFPVRCPKWGLEPSLIPDMRAVR